MRIESLSLTRYGHFTDKVLTFAPKAADGSDLHIVYGPNEAGKSTFFSAWLDLLFGIQTRTRYDFLHAGPTMQLGAELSHAGKSQAIRRVKKNAYSLLDAHGAALPDTTLNAMLAGLTRETYASMFSLDDETIEQGGKSILASHGNLGEMLFSASAGLSDLAPKLDQARERADAFYRLGKTSRINGRLAEGTKQLDALKERRKALEVSATTVRSLSRAAEEAQAQWVEAREALESLSARHEELLAQEAVLPLLQRRMDLRSRLDALGPLPSAPPEARTQLAEIERAEIQLRQRQQDRATRHATRLAREAALLRDPKVLAAADQIRKVDALKAEHDTALRDLPRRETELTEANRVVQHHLSELGQANRPVAEVLVPALQLSQLRSALEARSGLIEAHASALRERDAATARLEDECLRLGPLGEESDEGALDALRARLRARDPLQAHHRATEDVAALRRERDTRMAALAPWTGTAEALMALPVPRAPEIAALGARQEASRIALGDALRAHETARAEAQTTSPLGQAPAPQINLEDVLAARSSREAAWALHLQNLTTKSAGQFERAMREDDRLSGLLAQAQAESREAALRAEAQAKAAERLLRAETALARAQEEDACATSATAALSTQLGLPQDWTLAEVRDWLARRLTACEAQQSLHQAEATLRQSKQALTEAVLSLRIALAEDKAPEDGPPEILYDVLYARATARSEAAERRRDARALLRGLEAAKLRRTADFTAANDALHAWREAWRAMTAQTVLASTPDDAPHLGRLLDHLERLGQAHSDAAGLADRIAKMTANRDRFIAEKVALWGALEMAPDAGWPDLVARLTHAQNAARDLEAVAKDRAEENILATEDEATERNLAERRAALATALEWDGSGTLAERLEACLTAQTLRGELSDLDRDLAQRPVAAALLENGPEDLASHHARELSLRAELSALRNDLAAARDRNDLAHRAHIEASHRLEEIGSDAELVRIAAERSALVEQLADEARSYLSRRLGLLTFDTALRRYRDEHRSSMLRRASDAFSRLSRGNYTALSAQPDGQTEVLVAHAASGGTKLAADMSKGTRFQLYLALRIAGYHELARGTDTVPFIADDIMETFDDARSEAAFGLLGEMSQVGQVIYLTHHRHLCDLARAACPSAQVIDLSRV